MGIETTRHFNEQDVLYLIRRAPVTSLSRLSSAVAYLKHSVQLGTDMGPLLALYPQERMEELEFFYGCLEGMGVLDERLLSDLVVHFSWRGVVLGSWLSIFQPDPELLPVLESVSMELPKSQWAVELALSVNRGQLPTPAHEEVAALAGQCRALMEGLARPQIPMRPAPTAAQRAVMDEERERIRRLYRSQGADAALGLIGKTEAHRHFMTHERWRASQDGDPPSEETD